MNSESGEQPIERYLFSGVTFRPPLEELRLIGEKKIATYEELGENARAKECRRAHELARERLAAILGEEG